MEVEYRDIEGAPGYRIGSDGTVWRCTWRKLVPQRNKYGHLSVNFLYTALKKMRSVHSLVLEAFVGPRPEGLECCHNDGNPANNNLSNLRWDTRKSNAEDMVKHNKQAKGERIAQSKLTEDKVRDIRTDYVSGEYTEVALGKKYGVSRATIHRTATGHSWKHVT